MRFICSSSSLFFSQKQIQGLDLEVPSDGVGGEGWIVNDATLRWTVSREKTL